MGSLTRSITDRVFVGLLSLIFAPICAFFLYVRFTLGEPFQHEDWVLRLLVLIVFEGIGAVFLISVLGLIWALWTPNWIERLLRQAFRHFVFVLFTFGIVISGIALFLLRTYS